MAIKCLQKALDIHRGLSGNNTLLLIEEDTRDLVRAVVMKGSIKLLNNFDDVITIMQIFDQAVLYYDSIFPDDPNKGVFRTSMFKMCIESAYNNQKLEEAKLYCSAIIKILSIRQSPNPMFCDRLEEIMRILDVERLLLKQYSKNEKVTKYKFSLTANKECIQKYFSDILQEQRETTIVDDDNGNLEINVSDHVLQSKLRTRLDCLQNASATSEITQIDQEIESCCTGALPTLYDHT